MSEEKEIPLDKPAPKVEVVNEQPDKKSPDNIIGRLLSASQDEILGWERVTLPSMGQYYEGRVPGGVVHVKPMGLQADKIMSTARLIQTGQSLEYIYRHHVKLPEGFNHMELLTGDRVYLLFYIRAITHGNEYEFTMKCSNTSCGVDSPHQYDLNNLESEKRGPKHKQEPVRVALPFLSKKMGEDVWAECRYLRASDIENIAKKARFREKLKGRAVRSAKSGKSMAQESISLNDEIEQNLDLAVVSINGETDPIKVQKIIKVFGQPDTQAIRDFIDTVPGVDTEIVVTCPHCDNEMRVELPITESFFRPKNRGGM